MSLWSATIFEILINYLEDDDYLFFNHAQLKISKSFEKILEMISFDNLWVLLSLVVFNKFELIIM